MSGIEDINRAENPGPGSIRAFGWVMAFAIPAITFIVAQSFSWWPVAIGALFALAAILELALLHPLNRLWHRFGLLLGKIVAPLVLGIIFALVVTPIGLVRRLAGADSLRLKRDDDAKSYWIERDPPGPDPEHLPRQF